MLTFKDLSLPEITALRDGVTALAEGESSVRGAMDKVLERLYQQFAGSLVLVRAFATVRFGELPDREQGFASRRAEERGVSSELDERTPVVTLMASRGTDPAWNDPHQSKNHLAIPIVSASFIKTIPLVARMLGDNFPDLPWLAKQKSRILVKSMGRMSRLIYVGSAATETTQDGYKVLPAQEFVRTYGVKTTIGLGGGYLDGTFLALVLFTRESIAEPQTTKLTPLVNSIKTATMKLVMSRRFF